jgi:putative transposase
MPARKKPVLPDELVDQLMSGRDPSTVFDKNGLLDELKRAIAERVLNAEMDHHLSTEATAGDGKQQPQRLRQEDGADRYRQARDFAAA